MKFRFAYFLVILSNLSANAVLANMEYDGNVSLGINDNVTNAINKGDIIDDQFVSAELNIGNFRAFPSGKSFLISGHLASETYKDAEGLNRFSYGASATYIQRLGLGAYAPRFKASFRVDKRNYKTSMRDGWLYRGSLSLEKRFTPELHASATFTREERTANAKLTQSYYAQLPSDVFNQQNNELNVSADYTLQNNSVITAQYVYRDGEVDASTSPASNFFFFTKAVTQDYEICNNCGNYVAYLVGARIHSFMVDWNWALGRNASVSTSFERRIADTSGGITYTGNVFRVQLNRRF